MTTASVALELTAEQRALRVAVAKDVLAQLAAEKLRLIYASYFRYEPGFTRGMADDYGSSSARLHIDNIQKNCEVCARGALLLCSIRVNNQVSVSDLVERRTINELEAKADVFDIKTTALIEAAYMLNGVYATDYGHDENHAGIAVAFGKEYDEKDDRLKAIMENIVANKGELVF